MKKLTTFALMTALATGAIAHSTVDETTPQNGATISQAPPQIGFNFASDIRLTRVEMFYQDQPSVRLDLGDQTRFDRVFTLPLEGMGVGTYRIEWRGLGADGHALQGEFSFTVE